MSWKYNMCSLVDDDSQNCYCVVVDDVMTRKMLLSVSVSQRRCLFYAVSGMIDPVCVYYDKKNCNCLCEEAIGDAVFIRKLENL